MKKLLDLKPYGQNGFSWKVFDSDEAAWREYNGQSYEADEYRTNAHGEGLWQNERQVRGTCDYTACATVSGQRRKIKREIASEE